MADKPKIDTRYNQVPAPTKSPSQIKKSDNIQIPNQAQIVGMLQPRLETTKQQMIQIIDENRNYVQNIEKPVIAGNNFLENPAGALIDWGKKVWDGTQRIGTALTQAVPGGLQDHNYEGTTLETILHNPKMWPERAQQAATALGYINQRLKENKTATTQNTDVINYYNEFVEQGRRGISLYDQVEGSLKAQPRTAEQQASIQQQYIDLQKQFPLFIQRMSSAVDPQAVRDYGLQDNRWLRDFNLMKYMEGTDGR